MRITSSTSWTKIFPSPILPVAAAELIASTAGSAPVEALRERLVNLAPGTLAPGRGTRTTLHHMSVLVIRRAPDRLAVLGMRSAADSLWHALSETAARLETQE